MPSEPSVTVKSVTPSTFAAYPDPIQSNHFKGFNQQKSRAYVEAYLFVADPNIVICHVTLQNADLGISSNVIRPPDLLLVSKGNYQLWIANFHAIWGKRVGERVSELNAVLDYATSNLITKLPSLIHSSCNGIGWPVTKVVLAGDFNLSVEQINKQIQNRPGWAVFQEEDSTLNLQGMLSSSYDHFVALNIDPTVVNVELMLACDHKILKPNCSSYRTNTSDHIGVLLTIK
ncbi:MAG: hypothetical protein E5Y73_05425 [Mesorhizobium sp.]|uniref:hypothetical protein n=1 Tax=Mesorhizobium sp. TaxID=1871066 RepID=UPI001223392E|nr:hypothetical protein [Mesorhizobium sp.]TIL95685.1 MAG: hypothetical protein E5Y73_05425 [Mesorhizobium sp.]